MESVPAFILSREERCPSHTTAGLQGAAYKLLGSGAVTLLILWWETRR
ncbi:hypothetical protein AB0C39_23010 [Streptomyces parvulus]